MKLVAIHPLHFVRKSASTACKIHPLRQQECEHTKALNQSSLREGPYTTDNAWITHPAWILQVCIAKANAKQNPQKARVPSVQEAVEQLFVQFCVQNLLKYCTNCTHCTYWSIRRSNSGTYCTLLHTILHFCTQYGNRLAWFRRRLRLVFRHITPCAYIFELVISRSLLPCLRESLAKRFTLCSH